MHGGTPKAHLHLFSSLFGEKTHIRFPELIRACVACPVLLRPLRLFHLQLQRKFFWCEFWSRHQLPCLDPADEALFGCLMVAPSLERSLVNHSTLEKSWRLTARRLLGWIRVRTTKTSSTYWLELELDECRDLDDELTVTPIYVFETTNLLRDMYGLRFGKLLADLLFDRKSFAIGALYDAVWKLSFVGLPAVEPTRPRGQRHVDGVESPRHRTGARTLIPTQARRALEGLRHAHPRAYGGWRRGPESEWRDDGDTT